MDAAKESELLDIIAEAFGLPLKSNQSRRGLTAAVVGSKCRERRGLPSQTTPAELSRSSVALPVSRRADQEATEEVRAVVRKCLYDGDTVIESCQEITSLRSTVFSRNRARGGDRSSNVGGRHVGEDEGEEEVDDVAAALDLMDEQGSVVRPLESIVRQFAHSDEFEAGDDDGDGDSEGGEAAPPKLVERGGGGASIIITRDPDIDRLPPIHDRPNALQDADEAADGATFPRRGAPLKDEVIATAAAYRSAARDGVSRARRVIASTTALDDEKDQENGSAGGADVTRVRRASPDCRSGAAAYKSATATATSSYNGMKGAGQVVSNQQQHHASSFSFASSHGKPSRPPLARPAPQRRPQPQAPVAAQSFHPVLVQ